MKQFDGLFGDPDGRPEMSCPSRREVLRYTATSMAIVIPGAVVAGRRRHNRIVETRNGKLQGYVQDGVATFKGVHYGQSTAGRNRFRSAQPVTPWAGVRDASRLGHPCPQDNPDYVSWVDPMPGDEDCLVLNIWSPEGARPASKLAVMIWIHGGGYTFGSAGAPLYDCTHLARAGGVVAVGINHRLHGFGFSDVGAAGGDFADSGNAGQLDVLAAVNWVRANIEAFGGDADNITLFGQSGGGAKISTLMGMPDANGTFKRVIVQSGSVFRYRTRDEAEATSRRVYSILGIANGNVAALQAVPATILKKCFYQVMSEPNRVSHPSLLFAPVLDGRRIPERPWHHSAPPGAGEVAMMVGTTKDETAIYVSEEDRRQLGGKGDVVSAIVNSTPAFVPDRARVAELVSQYRKLMPGKTDLELVVMASTDLSYFKGAVHQAELQSAAGAPVYMYRCDWKTPCFGGMWAPHATEIPLVLGFRHYGPAWDGKDSDVARAAADPGNARYLLGTRMQAAWVDFAKGGTPSAPQLKWPKYDQNQRATMIFDGKSRVIDDPEREARILLQNF